VKEEVTFGTADLKKKKRLLGIPVEGKKVRETKSGAQHASNDEDTDIVVF